MQSGKENLKKFSPAGIHTHTHTNLLTTEIHEVSFPPQIAGASRGGNKRAEIQEYSSQRFLTSVIPVKRSNQ